MVVSLEPQKPQSPPPEIEDLVISRLGCGSEGIIELVKKKGNRFYARKRPARTGSLDREIALVTKFNVEKGLLTPHFIQDGMIYYPVMSMSLKKYSKNHVIDRGRYLDICMVVASAIKDLAERYQMAHLDIKEENVLVKINGSTINVKLADFGRARKIGEVSMTACGTVNFTAPELFQEAEIKTSADIYSFGVFMFQLLSNDQTIFSRHYDNDMSLIYDLGQNVVAHKDQITSLSVLKKKLLNASLFPIDSIEDPILRLIGDCIQINPDNRPSIDTVIDRLSKQCPITC